MFLVEAEDLTLPRARAGLSRQILLRQRPFYFRQVLNAVAQQRDLSSRGRHARDDVVVFATQ